MILKENLIRLKSSLDDNPNHDIEEILELISDTSIDEIRAASEQFASLCHSLTNALIKSKRSVCGINILSIAISKIQNHKFQLTPIHSDLCLLCLDSKCLNPAIKFLEADFTEIQKAEDKEENVKHVLLYYYYGGLIYAAVKNFERASYFLEVVLTVPANFMNPIMQETYKKHIILTLLLNGKLPENILPKYTSPCVLRPKKQGFHFYYRLAQEYSSLNYEKIRRLVTTNSALYERDENMGLIRQCLTQVHKRNIQRLTKTFLTLPLRDVANHVGLATEREAELYILNMIDDGDIFATINQKDGMVVFQDNPEKFDTVTIFQKLQDDMSTSIMLINTLKKLDCESTSESKILSKLNSDVQ